mgnify:CR=1 FL=1
MDRDPAETAALIVGAAGRRRSRFVDARRRLRPARTIRRVPCVSPSGRRDRHRRPARRRHPARRRPRSGRGDCRERRRAARARPSARPPRARPTPPDRAARRRVDRRDLAAIPSRRRTTEGPNARPIAPSRLRRTSRRRPGPGPPRRLDLSGHRRAPELAARAAPTGPRSPSHGDAGRQARPQALRALQRSFRLGGPFGPRKADARQPASRHRARGAAGGRQATASRARARRSRRQGVRHASAAPSQALPAAGITPETSEEPSASTTAAGARRTRSRPSAAVTASKPPQPTLVRGRVAWIEGVRRSRRDSGPGRRSPAASKRRRPGAVHGSAAGASGSGRTVLSRNASGSVTAATAGSAIRLCAGKSRWPVVR